jgi:hypothetical protein
MRLADPGSVPINEVPDCRTIGILHKGSQQFGVAFAAQKLARHSTPVLTATRYTHIVLADQSREVQKLPWLLGTNEGQTADVSCPKTSTDGNKNAAEFPGENPKKPAAISRKMQRRGGDSISGISATSLCNAISGKRLETA